MEGQTALYIACEKGQVDAARLLLDKGADVDRAEKDDAGRRCSSPAMRATSKRRGCCWTKARTSTGRWRRDGEGQTPLSSPAGDGHVDVVRLLLEKGAEVDRAKEDGWTPLLIACQQGHVERRGCCWRKARRLIGRRGRSGRRCTSPASAATSTRRGCCWTKARRSIGRWRTEDAAMDRLPERFDAARLLLDKGAEVDRADKEGWTPLYVACQESRAAAGERRGGRSEQGATPLHVACREGHVDAARLLLDKGAEVDRAMEDGATPLNIACQKGHVDAARLLLEKGAEVDRADEEWDGRRCTSPASSATSTRCGCCWRKARRSIGRISRARRRWTQQRNAVMTQSSRSSRTTFTRQTSTRRHIPPKEAAKIWRA